GWDYEPRCRCVVYVGHERSTTDDTAGGEQGDTGRGSTQDGRARSVVGYSESLRVRDARIFEGPTYPSIENRALDGHGADHSPRSLPHHCGKVFPRTRRAFLRGFEGCRTQAQRVREKSASWLQDSHGWRLLPATQGVRGTQHSNGSVGVPDFPSPGLS